MQPALGGAALGKQAIMECIGRQVGAVGPTNRAEFINGHKAEKRPLAERLENRRIQRGRESLMRRGIDQRLRPL